MGAGEGGGTYLGVYDDQLDRDVFSDGNTFELATVHTGTRHSFQFLPYTTYIRQV